MPTLVQDEAGSLFVDTGGGVLQPVTPEQARTFQQNQGMGEAAFQAAGQGLENLITGGASLLSDNPYWMQANQQGRAQNEALEMAQPIAAGAGEFAPQAAIGIATGSLGILPTAGVEAALGAATTPEAPVQGALLGGLTGGAAAALPGAAQYLGQQGRRLAGNIPFLNRSAGGFDDIPINPGGMMPGERPPIPGAGPETAGAPAGPIAGAASVPGAPGGAAGAATTQPPRMADRVMQNLSEADRATTPAPAGEFRVMEGTMDPAELYTYGVPTSPAQRALLGARGAEEGASARAALAQEEAAMSHPVLGGQHRAIRDAQQQSATNYLARQLNLPQDVNLLDPVVSDVFARLGGRFDAIAQEMGTVSITPRIQADMTEILNQSTGAHRHQLGELVNEVNAKAQLNGGAITGDDWIEMRTKINKMIDSGTKQSSIGKISDARDLLDTLTEAMESTLPDATRAELEQLRHQYSIAKVLTKPGVTNADGQINPVSFYNNWKRPQGQTRRGRDDIGRFMNTIVTLTKKRTPDSGTAGRLLSNLAGMGADLIPGGRLLRRATGL